MEYADLDPSRRYTYADYLTWTFPEQVELILGTIFRMSPAPSTGHQRVLMRLSAQIHRFLEGRRCEVFPAPFDVRLPPRPGSISPAEVDTVVQPDISVICDPSKIDDRGCLGAPDWVIEILSPSSVRKDTKEKFDLYEKAGVKEYWLIHTGERYVLAYTRGEDGRFRGGRPYRSGDVLSPGLFPPFSIEVGPLFPDPDSVEEPWASYARQVMASENT